MTNKQNTVRHEGTRKYGHYANYDGVLKSLFGIRLMMRSFINEFGESLHLPSLERGELELFPTEHVSKDFRLRRNDLMSKPREFVHKLLFEFVRICSFSLSCFGDRKGDHGKVLTALVL